jgi:predicted RNA-binding Zn ribbon-like protein
MEPGALEAAVAAFRSFALDGGQLALDFTNTVDWRRTEKEHEWLKTYPDLLGWGVRVGLLGREMAETLAQSAQGEPDEAARALLQARELRELLFRVFNAVVEDRPPEPEDWRRFTEAVRTAMASAEIARKNGGFFWSFDHEMQRLDFFRGPLLKAASELLIDGDLSRLKRCGTPDCQWLFLDTSKNNSRRWCDMQSCGNRAKARRHYQRARQSRGPRGT